MVYIPPDPISLCERTEINNFGFVPGKVFRDQARALYKMGVLLLVIAVDLVALVGVMTWLGLTGKFGQGNISAPLTTPIHTMFPSTMSPTLRMTLRPSLSPQKCYTPTPLLQLAAENVDKFGDSASMFTDWSIVGAHRSSKAYFYKKVLGDWYYGQNIQASDGSDDDSFGRSVYIYEKIVVVGAPNKDNGAVYVFMLQGETWTEDKTLTASDLALGDYFGLSVAISGDTLLVGAPYKDGQRGAAYVFFLDVVAHCATRALETRIPVRYRLLEHLT